MEIVYCRLETTTHETVDYQFESTNKLSKKEFEYLQRSYLYLVYYFSVTTSMTDGDLDFFDLYSPPFTKAVFIFKIKDKYLKLNYTDTPLSYQLSHFYPERNESSIISTQSREITAYLEEQVGFDTWEHYKLIYSLFEKTEEEQEENTLSLVSSYGDDYTVDNDEHEENTLSLATTSVQLDEYEEASFSNDFDTLSLVEKREKLETNKKNLKDAIEIKELNASLKEINKRLKYYSGIKKEIESFNIIIEQKEKEREQFKDIHWMSKNLYNQLNLYIKKKKKCEDDLVAYEEKLEKNKKDIESITPDNILKNKIFTPTFLLAIITFVLSWVVREQFWYLSGASIIFFTISFYYLWGYLDYVEYIIKLKREKNFYEKKLGRIESDFQKEFGNVEAILEKEKVEDVQIPIDRFEELKEFDIKLEEVKEKLQTFIAQKFSEDTQTKFEALIADKERDLTRLKSFPNRDLNYKEIEYNIIELKKSIKDHETKELDEFSLDDDLSLEPSAPLELKEEKVESLETFEKTYSLASLGDYLKELAEYFSKDASELYELFKKDFIDILDFSINYPHALRVDVSTSEYVLNTNKELTWDAKSERKFKFYLQYAVLKYIASTKAFPLFIDLNRINEEYGILFASYLNDLNKAQVIYAE